MCGIFGELTINEPELDKTHILGLFNQSRGTDSCGLYWNNGVIHGVGLNSKYENFLQAFKFTDWNGKSKITFGHTRQRSVGAITESNAHPFAVGKTTKAKRPSIVGVHNGTISNIDDLAEQYKVDVSDCEVDSHKLFKILLLKDFSVLEHYIGAAALMFHYPISEPNVLYVFKGASHLYDDQKVIVEERPLFTFLSKNGNRYFSSLETSLKAIGGSGISTNSNHVKKIPNNVLLKYHIDGTIEEIPINRDKDEVYQKLWGGTTSKSKKYGASTQVNDLPTVPQHTSTKNSIQKPIGFKPDMRIIRDSYVIGAFQVNPKLTRDLTVKEIRNRLLTWAPKMIDSYRKDAKNLDRFILDISKEPAYTPSTPNVVYHKGVLSVNGHTMHTEKLPEANVLVYISNEGELRYRETEGFDPFFVLNGVAFRPVDFLEYVRNVSGLATWTPAKLLTTKRGAITFMPSIADSHSFTPVYVPSAGRFYLDGEALKGLYQPPFSDREYFFIEGYLVAILTDDDSSPILQISTALLEELSIPFESKPVSTAASNGSPTINLGRVLMNYSENITSLTNREKFFEREEIEDFGEEINKVIFDYVNKVSGTTMEKYGDRAKEVGQYMNNTLTRTFLAQ